MMDVKRHVQEKLNQTKQTNDHKEQENLYCTINFDSHAQHPSNTPKLIQNESLVQQIIYSRILKPSARGSHAVRTNSKIPCQQEDHLQKLLLLFVQGLLDPIVLIIF